jgi:hypothetical protein
VRIRRVKRREQASNTERCRTEEHNSERPERGSYGA